jgi:hypothetical protein
MFELRTLTDYSDESLLAELRRVSSLLNGKRLTVEKFDKLARVSSSTLRVRFGSWKNALDRANISETIAPRFRKLTREMIIEELRAYAREFPGRFVTKKEIAKRIGVNSGSITRRFGKWINLLAEVSLSPVPGGRRYSDEECFENIVTLWTHYGRQPHYAELKRPPSTVGPKAYFLRWGSWRAALAAFIKYINQEPQSNPVQTAKETVSNDLAAEQIAIPRSISLSLRYKVLCRDRFRCVICGRSPAQNPNIELHVDHFEPWSKGGPNTEENLRTLCSDCNLGKGARIEKV